MKVRDIMTEPVVTITEDTTLEEAARLMLERGIGGVPVVDKNGALAGIVTESDFTAREKCFPFSVYRSPQLFGSWLGNDAAEVYARASKIPAREVMSTNVVTVTENDSIDTVLQLILKYDVNRIPVVHEGKPVGIVARRDLLKAMKNLNPVAAGG